MIAPANSREGELDVAIEERLVAAWDEELECWPAGIEDRAEVLGVRGLIAIMEDRHRRATRTIHGAIDVPEDRDAEPGFELADDGREHRLADAGIGPRRIGDQRRRQGLQDGLAARRHAFRLPVGDRDRQREGRRRRLERAMIDGDLERGAIRIVLADVAGEATERGIRLDGCQRPRIERVQRRPERDGRRPIHGALDLHVEAIEAPLEPVLEQILAAILELQLIAHGAAGWSLQRVLEVWLKLAMPTPATWAFGAAIVSVMDVKLEPPICVASGVLAEPSTEIVPLTFFAVMML